MYKLRILSHASFNNMPVVIDMMETVKLSPLGQIPIPKGILEAGHLVPGTEFSVSLVGTEIRIRPVERIVPSRLAAVAGCLHRPERVALTAGQTEQAIAEMLADQDRTCRE